MTIVAHCEDLFLADGGKINEGEVSEKLGVKGILPVPRTAELQEKLHLPPLLMSLFISAMSAPKQALHLSVMPKGEVLR